MGPPSQQGSAETVQKCSDQPDISQAYTSIHIEGMFGMQRILNQAGAQTDLAAVFNSSLPHFKHKLCRRVGDEQNDAFEATEGIFYSLLAR